jgi:hypothetical protein
MAFENELGRQSCGSLWKLYVVIHSLYHLTNSLTPSLNSTQAPPAFVHSSDFFSK